MGSDTDQGPVMDFITGTAAGLNQGIYAGVSRYRRKMFMETLGWQLDSAHQSPYLLAEVFPQLLRRAGLSACRAGPPVIVDGPPLFACWIEVLQAPSHPAEQRRADVQLTDFR
jgi:N-acyl-L-homoserine lactone synthetase